MSICDKLMSLLLLLTLVVGCGGKDSKDSKKGDGTAKAMSQPGPRLVLKRPRSSSTIQRPIKRSITVG